LGVIKWDFKHLRMNFTYQGHSLTLRGIKVHKPQLLSQEQLPKALNNASHLCMLQMLSENDSDYKPLRDASEQAIDPTFHQSLATYEDIFQEPSALPPLRGHFDHKIALKEGTSPINLRPYK